MLVDHGRNDLGRVCEPGSVEVVDFMTVRRYSHVMHIESTVTGRLRPGRVAFRRPAGMTSAGTLSGAPKPRAMEIIEELEPTRRGLYGGIVGYLDLAGDLDAAIAIRTALPRTGWRTSRRGGDRRRFRLGRRGYRVAQQGCVPSLRAIAIAGIVRPAR